MVDAPLISATELASLDATGLGELGAKLLQRTCAHCRTLVQAPVPAEIIDKGIPTSGLLAQVLVAKYTDHLPLYRQEQIFGRAGLSLPR